MNVRHRFAQPYHSLQDHQDNKNFEISPCTTELMCISIVVGESIVDLLQSMLTLFLDISILSGELIIKISNLLVFNLSKDDWICFSSTLGLMEW
jgi:hypothetical protein